MKVFSSAPQLPLLLRHAERPTQYAEHDLLTWVLPVHLFYCWHMSLTRWALPARKLHSAQAAPGTYRYVFHCRSQSKVLVARGVLGGWLEGGAGRGQGLRTPSGVQAPMVTDVFAFLSPRQIQTLVPFETVQWAVRYSEKDDQVSTHCSIITSPVPA